MDFVTSLTNELPRANDPSEEDRYRSPCKVAKFILRWLRRDYGESFRASCAPLASDDVLRLHQDPWPEVAHYRWRRVPDGARLALWKWHLGEWSLVLRPDVPSPMEVLTAQAQGQRLVTLIEDETRIQKPIEDHTNAFEFIIHDLRHAEKFFGDPRGHVLQVALARRLLRGLMEFPELAQGDNIFERQFAYAISDMNSHPLHTLMCLVAYRREFLLRQGAPVSQAPPEALRRWWGQLLSLNKVDPLWTLLQGHRPNPKEVEPMLAGLSAEAGFGGPQELFPPTE